VNIHRLLKNTGLRIFRLVKKENSIRIAVPTSIGYGANFGGISALLGMLTRCAIGVSVVNIGNGFGDGYCASMINKL